jgi:thioredoxin-like negative regulator of GroEL
MATTMTPAEHAKKASQLKGAVTRAKTKVKACGTLAEKLEALKVVREAEENLRQHKLRFHELTAAAPLAAA